MASGKCTLNRATGVIRPVAYDTITIPATAGGCISVGAYNSYTGAYAAFSGRGSALTDVLTAGIKPDILAPGVDIMYKKGYQTGSGVYKRDRYIICNAVCDGGGGHFLCSGG